MYSMKILQCEVKDSATGVSIIVTVSSEGWDIVLYSVNI